MTIYMVLPIISIALCVTAFAQQESSSQQQAEKLLQKGEEAFKAGQYKESEEMLNQSLNLDPSADKTKDYLNKIEEQRKQRTGSRESVKDYAESQADDDLEKGARQGDDLLKSDYKSRKKDADAPESQKLKYLGHRYETVRPQQYLLPQMYSRLGFPVTSPFQLDTTRFRTSKDDIYRSASRWPDRLRRQFDGSFLLHYDSNVADVNQDRFASSGLTRKSGISQNALAALSAYSTPLKRFAYGGDLRTLFRFFSASDLRLFSYLSAAPAVSASWWNTRSMEVSARYDYAFTARDPKNFGYFNQVHGPQIGMSNLIAKEYQIDSAYSLKRNHYSNDIVANAAQFGGTEHTLSSKFTYAKMKSNFRYFGQYVFDHNRTNDKEWRANTHAFEAGLTFAFTAKARASLSVMYQKMFFFADSTDRKDNLVHFRLATVFPVNDSFTVLFDSTHSKYKSNIGDTYSYYRLAGVLGLMYSLPF